MTHLAWATDVHLDFLSDHEVLNFATRLVADNPSAVVITGDVSVADRLIYHLSVIERVAQRPVYFVLGNHDYYGGSIEKVRQDMKGLTNLSQFLRYLPSTPYVALTPSTALVGHDCWYDAMNGDWRRSNFFMTDWTHIKEFVVGAGVRRGDPHTANMSMIVETARKLSHEGATHVHDGIKAAARYHKNVIVAAHVPPFPETHIYEGKAGDPGAQPWFTSKLFGDVMMDASRAFPKVNFTVIAGHTHGEYSGKIADNLTVHVGGAEYRRPKLQKLIEVQ